MQAALRFPPKLLRQARGLKVVFLDVDGVLTDGGLIYSASGETLKRFHSLDGYGLKLLQGAGITPVVISGGDSKALRVRLAALGIDRAHFSIHNKRLVAEQNLQALGLNWQQAAAMGDDWPDLPVLRNCALAFAPPHAHLEVKALAHHITSAPAGQGAVRELCDLLLMANGVYARCLQQEGAP